MQVWFWTEDITEPFVILSVQTTIEAASWYDLSLIINKDLTDESGGSAPFFTLGVQGDGLFFFEARLAHDTGGSSDFMYYVVATNLQARRGWNFIAVHFDEVYEITTVNMYHRSEEHTTSPYYEIFETILPGYYRPANQGGFLKHDDVIVLGCKSYQRVDHQMSSQSVWDFYPADVNYGFCMKGWLNTIEIWKSQKKWDDLFDADTELRADFNNFVL
jgi:hypothetical protein